MHMAARSDIERVRASLQAHIREAHKSMQEAHRMADKAAEMRAKAKETIQRMKEMRARLQSQWQNSHDGKRFPDPHPENESNKK
jgi:hypothetical protein